MARTKEGRKAEPERRKERAVVADILFLKRDSSIFRQSSKPICGFSVMDQLFGPQRTGLALPSTTHRVGRLSANATVML